MTSKSVITKNGMTVTAEIVRNVVDKVAYLDGQSDIIGREVVDYTTITLCDQTGKVIGTGSQLSPVNPRLDENAIAGGAVGKVGRIYLRQEMYNTIAALIAELEAETPKSAEQIAIETAEANALQEHNNWYNSPEEIAYREFNRRMEAEDSDL